MCNSTQQGYLKYLAKQKKKMLNNIFLWNYNLFQIITYILMYSFKTKCFGNLM